MKKLILFLLITSVSPIILAQQLNSNASFIKRNYPAEYSHILKKYALEKWNDNYEMVVYMINNQADALDGLINEFKSNNTHILYKAIQKWSYEGYKSSNIEKFDKLKIVNLKQLLSLQCNWEMVKYEYDNQVKAKNAF